MSLSESAAEELQDRKSRGPRCAASDFDCSSRVNGHSPLFLINVPDRTHRKLRDGSTTPVNLHFESKRSIVTGIRQLVQPLALPEEREAGWRETGFSSSSVFRMVSMPQNGSETQRHSSGRAQC